MVHRANLPDGMSIQVLLAFNEGRGSSRGKFVSTIAARAIDSSGGTTLSCETTPTGLKGLLPSMAKAYNSKRFANRITKNGGKVSPTDDAVLRVIASYNNYLRDLGLSLNEPLNESLFGYVWDFLGKMSPEAFITRGYEANATSVTAGELALFLGTKQGYRVREALEWKAQQSCVPTVEIDGLESLFEVIETNSPTVIGNLDRLVRQGFPLPVTWEARVENKTRCGDVVVKDDYARVTCSELSIGGVRATDDPGILHDPGAALRVALYRIMVEKCSNLFTEEFRNLFYAIEHDPIAMTDFRVGSGPVGPGIRNRLVFDLHLESLGTIQHPAVAGLLSKLRQTSTYFMEIGASEGVIRTRIKFSLSKFDHQFKFEPDIPAFMVGKAYGHGLGSAGPEVGSGKPSSRSG
jgi:hypothetical protein